MYHEYHMYRMRPYLLNVSPKELVLVVSQRTLCVSEGELVGGWLTSITTRIEDAERIMNVSAIYLQKVSWGRVSRTKMCIITYHDVSRMYHM